jgi:D-sedoheptulose 7-phosphate isomerase
MTMTSVIHTQILESIAVKKAVSNSQLIIQQIENLSVICLDSLRAGGKIIFAGNGGSFADAQHLSAEFVSRFMFDRAPLPSIALGTNNSSISAIGNDYGYEQIFARELAAMACTRDVFIPISTSGNSPNIIAAVEVAKKNNIRTLVFTGEKGGKLKSISECICVPSSDTARIQECHIMLGHIVCGLVESSFFNKEVRHEGS